MKIGKIFNYEIVEDNNVKEIRLPREVINLIKDLELKTRNPKFNNIFNKIYPAEVTNEYGFKRKFTIEGIKGGIVYKNEQKSTK